MGLKEQEHQLGEICATLLEQGWVASCSSWGEKKRKGKKVNVLVGAKST